MDVLYHGRKQDLLLVLKENVNTKDIIPVDSGWLFRLKIIYNKHLFVWWYNECNGTLGWLYLYSYEVKTSWFDVNISGLTDWWSGWELILFPMQGEKMFSWIIYLVVDLIFKKKIKPCLKLRWLYYNILRLSNYMVMVIVTILICLICILYEVKKTYTVIY